MFSVRNATPEDAPVLATCMLLAMEAIVYGFLGRADYEAAHRFLKHFAFLPGNQYSYENCRVAVAGDGQVVGTINLYDGAQLQLLRQPVVDRVRQYHQPQFQPEDETGPGEYYIDTLGVLPHWQGRGIGRLLLERVIQEYGEQQQVLGLLVEADNTGAAQLYRSLGFRVVAEKMVFGKWMVHMQKTATV